MVQSPSWEANWFVASQEIPHISRNNKVHYRTHKHLPPVSIVGQPNPVHIPTSHLLEIHPNIIHPSTPRSPKWSPFLWFPHQDLIHPSLLTHMRRMPSPSHSSDIITRTILGEEYKLFSSSLCNLLHSPVASSLLGRNILLNTMLSNTLSFLSSCNVNDQVSHPYKTTGKIIVLYILIFKFLDSNLEDKRFWTEWKQAFPDLKLLLISWVHFVKYMRAKLTFCHSDLLFYFTCVTLLSFSLTPFKKKVKTYIPHGIACAVCDNVIHQVILCLLAQLSIALWSRTDTKNGWPQNNTLFSLWYCCFFSLSIISVLHWQKTVYLIKSFPCYFFLGGGEEGAHFIPLFFIYSGIWLNHSILGHLTHLFSLNFNTDDIQYTKLNHLSHLAKTT